MGVSEINSELEFLFRIHTKETPCIVELPGGHQSYSIDLNTRKINSPQILSVKKDHMSTVIYFNVDRFYDYMDLSTLSCVIIYQTPDGQTHFYPVQYYDIFTLKSEAKMVIAWNINDIVTSQSGTITYAFKFFKVQGDLIENAELIYNLNTAPAQSTILYGLDAPKAALNQEETKEVNEIVRQLEFALDAVRKAREEFQWTVYE